MIQRRDSAVSNPASSSSHRREISEVACKEPRPGAGGSRRRVLGLGSLSEGLRGKQQMSFTSEFAPAPRRFLSGF